MPTGEHFSVTDSVVVHQNPIFAVRVDDVTMPDGRTAKRAVVEKFAAVAVVAIDDDGRIVLINQYRHPIGAPVLELPAGMLDAMATTGRRGDEAGLAGAQRELLEEVGVAASEWDVLVDILGSPGFTDESIRVFRARGLSYPGRLDRVEHEAGQADEESVMDISWVPLEEAVGLVLAGEIVNGAAVAGILAAATLAGRPGRPVDADWSTRSQAFPDRLDPSASNNNNQPSTPAAGR